MAISSIVELVSLVIAFTICCTLIAFANKFRIAAFWKPPAVP